jgi:hypothetical protein
MAGAWRTAAGPGLTAVDHNVLRWRSDGTLNHQHIPALAGVLTRRLLPRQARPQEPADETREIRSDDHGGTKVPATGRKPARGIDPFTRVG